MAQIRLVTRDGRHVVTIWMPAFVRWPEAVQWGQRTFFCTQAPGEALPSYFEGLLWWAPPGAEVAEEVARAGEEVSATFTSS